MVLYHPLEPGQASGNHIAKQSVNTGNVFELKSKVLCQSKCQACHVSTCNVIKKLSKVFHFPGVNSNT